jgi:hypothetical protein
MAHRGDQRQGSDQIGQNQRGPDLRGSEAWKQEEARTQRRARGDRVDVEKGELLLEAAS